MAAITPQTNLKLLRVPIELDNINQLTFSNATSQYSYFNGLTNKLEVDNFTYQRKDGVIRMPGTLDDLWQYNYVMYQNEGFNNKWIYAQIERMEFVSPGMTDIYIKTDVFQTWQFDLEYKQCFVEREHVSNDAIGAHTVPEGLETGDFVINGGRGYIEPDKIVHTIVPTETIPYYNLIVFQVTELPSTVYFNQSYNVYNKVYSGLHFIAVGEAEEAQALLRAYDHEAKRDAIVSIFMAPKELFEGCYSADFNVITGSGNVQVHIYKPVDSYYASKITEDKTVTLNQTIDGYTPKNNKLYTGEFNYLYMDNNTGITSIFNYEDFANNTPTFAIYGTLSQGCSTKLIPDHYLHENSQIPEVSYGMMGYKYPICGWNTDSYVNWLTQNGVNTAISTAESVASSAALGIAGAVMGNVGMGAIGTINAITAITDTVHQFKVHSKEPNQARGNVNGSELHFALGSTYFNYYQMSVRSEYAQIIDNYFSMFGYKVSVVKVPNITGRANWNYVKTVNSKIHGFIPQEDLRELQSMFDNGVTFWHNPATFLDYSQNNGII